MTLAGYDSDLVEIVALVDRYAAKQEPLENARDLDGAGWYGDAWRQVCETTGLGAVCVAEDQGGLGLGVDVLIAIGEAIGRNLFASPYLSSAAIATTALSACGESAHELLGSMAEGSATVSVAWAEDPFSWLPSAQPATTATEDGSAVTLSGTKSLVLDADRVDHLVVHAVDASGTPGLYVCDASASGLTVRTDPSIDLITRSSRVDLDRVPATRLVAGEAATAALSDAIDVGLLVRAAIQIGGARATAGTVLTYVQQREQFNRTIGSFQAVKHQLADITTKVETAWALLANAARTAADVPAQRRVFAPLAAAYVAESYFEVAEMSLHLHGGIGFTWEADPHLFLKHAVATKALLGSPDELRELVAQRTDLATGFTALTVGTEV